jgi:protein TonB
MEIRSTFILSLLLHVTLSALLLFSVRLQGEGGRMLSEQVFFVDLKSDEVNPPAAVIRNAPFKTAVAGKARKAPEAVVEKISRNEEVIATDSVSLPVDSGEVSGAAESYGKTSAIEIIESESSAHGGGDVVANLQTADDKRGGLTEADALRLIIAAIERAKSYPALARRRSIEGTVYVSFSIGAEGGAGEIKVVKSSGYKILDEETVKAIKNAAPYPYVNERIEVPVTYRLND